MFQTIWYQAGRLAVQLYLHTIMRADIVRKAPMPPGPKILAVNHPSTNDPAYVSTLLFEHSTILILETLFKVPLFGTSLRWSGHVPVVEDKGKEALEEGIRRLKAGRTVMIFPEGVISPLEGGLHRGHSGIARMHLATGAPVIPIGIGLDPKQLKLVKTRVEGKGEIGTWYFHGPYAMTVGEPMEFVGSLDNYEHVRAVTERIMHRIHMLAHESSYRVNNLAPAIQPPAPLTPFPFGLRLKPVIE